MSRLLSALLLLQVVAPVPSPQLPGNTSPAQPVAPGASDPAAATFTSDAGLLLVAVKADKVADYEEAIRALQDALAKTTDERRRAIAEGWRVYKATDPNAKANIIYVHLIHPTVPQADYRPSILLDELLEGAPPELLSKYRDAIASPPSKLTMTEFAHMSVAPVVKKP